MSSTDWWRGAVVYQVYPRSFQDSDGDGVGDLPGITRRLAHIASLGVDAVWIAPFFKSPMADMGYDVSDYRDVDPLFGTLADFDALLAEAHRLGLKIIIDQVLSHTSDKHGWFVESRASRTNDKADWYVWAEAKPDGTAPNNWLSVFGGPAWEWDGVRMQYYMHSFLTSQPDLNFHEPAVQAALIDTMRFWLDRGVDGFRLDACNHYLHDARLRDNPPAFRGAAPDVQETNPYGFQEHRYDKTQRGNIAFLKRIRALLDEFSGRVAMGEVGDGARSPDTVGLYTKGGDRLHLCYTFDLFGTEFTPDYFRAIVGRFEKAAREGWVCWALSNHDVVRHVSRWTPAGEDPNEVAKLAILLLVALRGTICLYQGEELGLTEAELRFEDLRDPYGIRFWPAFKGRDGCRTPMVWEAAADNGGFTTGTPWLPVPQAHRRAAADVQAADPHSVLAAYRAAIGLRKAYPALATGSIRFLKAEGPILAWLRESEGEALLCLFNLSAEPATWAPGGLRGRIGETVAGGYEEAGRDLALGPWGRAVISLS
ncbi:alpha-glucosidase family protein [Flavisphingomonas formosensis]|uniref:alpha-glucosidase family protein n=1 Tax=Flavisphingomonas formosensis TaxID=861534 RepID=UPI0012F918C9|nr:alpha-glucosidase family protein [Sphingomonas formosensis]